MHARPTLPSLRFAWLMIALALVLSAGRVCAAMIGTGINPHAVQIADLNEDGIRDLVSGNDDSTVAVSLGRGDGTFEPKSQYSCGSSVTRIAVADLNQDGHL